MAKKGKKKRAERDIPQIVSDKIVEAMSNGVSPWQKPWKDDGTVRGLPYNPTTGKTYQGSNIMLLQIAAIQKGYSSEQWMGYGQSEALGGQVRKGEKSTMIIRVVTIFEKDPVTKKNTKEVRFRKVFGVNVFNAEQIDGLPEEIINPEGREPVPIPDVAKWVSETLGVNLQHGGNMACYIPSIDTVKVPYRDQFETEEGYNGTMFHEVTHWTGAKARLDRFKNGAFGSENYAREELVAEMGAAMLCAALGHPYVVEHHASYMASWRKAIKADKNVIIKAATDAAEAMNFILDLAARGEEKKAA